MTAEVGAGYHVGPAYALVTVTTGCEQDVLGWNYTPLNVKYDFRFGVAWRGLDVYVSRWCQHNVFGHYDEYWGLSLTLSYRNWRGEE
jgi:hypothetical protein